MNSMPSILNATAQPTQELCDKHNELKINLSGRTVCKSCAKEFMKQVHVEHEAEKNQAVREKHFAGAMLPSRHAESGFKNYQVKNNGQQIALTQCSTFAKDINHGMNRSLIMVGRTGTGKTHLSCSVAKNVLNQRKYARYITSEDMANEIANAWKKADDSEASAIYRFTEYDLLILDEYGLHDRHENRLQLVHKVLYSRYDAKKATMLISNMTIEELKKDLGDRLWSRFQHDGLTIVECNWNDSRVGGVV